MEYKVDVEAMIQQMKDYIMLEMLQKFSPDANTAELMGGVMQVFMKHGIPVETALSIFAELQPIFEKYSNKKENDQQ